jgi:hypothetical protein
MKLIPSALLVAAALTLGLSAHAQDANLKKTLAERIPQLDKIDEIRPTPMQGLYEVRIGTDLFYTDAKGNYLIQGELIDTKARRNLTEDRITKLTAVDFKDLPLQDAFTIVRGKGERKLAVFEDPNCGYCKRFRARPAEGGQRHHLPVPLPHPEPGLGREVAQHLVRQGQGHRLARHDAARQGPGRRQLRCDGTAAQPGPGQTQDHRHAHADL